jgi:hypothetical protein
MKEKSLSSRNLCYQIRRLRTAVTALTAAIANLSALVAARIAQETANTEAANTEAAVTGKRRKAPAFRHGDIRRIPPQGGKCLHFAQNRDTIVAW